MTTLRATLRPLRTELIGVAGLTALLGFAAGFVAARLLAFDLPAACLGGESFEIVCRGRQADAIEYQNFASSWASGIAYLSVLLPPLAGIVLGIATIAKELDQRTAVLAWSVGPSRRRWLLQRVAPLTGILVILGIGSTFVFEAMTQLGNPGAVARAERQFELIAVTGFGPAAAGISAFGITVVVGAMLGRLLPGILAAGTLVLFGSLLIQQGNDRMMAGESVVAEASVAGQGRQVDWLLRAPDGRILGWEEAYALYGDLETGELGPEVIEMTRYVPIEIYPEVAARYVLFHLVAGLMALTLAFAVVERRSP